MPCSYRKAAQAEQKLEKANVNALYQKSLRENPQLASNPLSRWQQKQAIKKEYAAAKRAGQAAGNTASTAKKTGKAAKTVKEKAQEAGAFVMRHKKGFLIAGAIFLLVCMLLNIMSSCSVLSQGIGSAISGTTYPSDDPELVAVEADYAAKEAALQAEIYNIESSHPGYDEYRYDLATKERMEHFSQLQREKAKKPAQLDEQAAEECRRVLSAFFAEMTEWERYMEQAGFEDAEAVPRLLAIWEKYVSEKPRPGYRPLGLSYSAQGTYNGEEFLDAEQITKNKLYIYTREKNTGFDRRFLMKRVGDGWKIDAVQERLDGWQRIGL